jgi:C1A family cysteine protease
LLGGHAILCSGYDAKKELYRLHNSWGPKWGKGGDCFISAKDMATLLKRRGEAAVPLKRQVPKGRAK